MKHLLFLLFTFFCISTSSSQDFNALDIVLFPGYHNSHEAFHIDQMGNHFIAGRGTGEIDFDFGPENSSLPATSNQDLYLTKYDADDNLVWLLSFDGTIRNNHITSLVSDENGNIYITGEFAGNLHLTDDGQNEITTDIINSSAFVAKFDSDGILLWKFTLGSDDENQIPRKIFLYENRLIVQLEYAGNFDVDPGPNATLLDDESNAMLVYDLDGAFIEAYSHKGRTFVQGSLIDAEGNLYICGNFSGLVSFDYKSNFSVLSTGQFDAFAIKYDKDFNLVWQKRASKSLASISFNKLALDSSNNVIVAGVLVDGITIGAFVTENDANYIINISEAGEYTGLTEILPQLSNIHSLETNSSNQIIISGDFNEVIDLDLSEGTHELIPHEEGEDYFFAVYDSELSLIGADQMHAFIIYMHTVYMDESDKIYVLTDLGAEGEAAFGSSQIFVPEFEENFIFYELDIEGCSNTSEDLSMDACSTIIVNDEIYTVSGEYQQILSNAQGCDSILNISVTIYPVYESFEDVKSCGPIEIDGMTFSNSGMHTIWYTSIDGCDSLIIFNIEVIEIDNSISFNPESIASNEDDADAYRWYDCNTNLPIAFETNFDFTPQYDGSFKVEITKDICVEFSDCLDFNLVSTKEYDFDIKISPNPTQGMLYIEVDNSGFEYRVSLLDLSGKEVIRPTKLNSDGILDLSQVVKGMYLLKLENQSRSAFRKIVVNP